MNHDRRRIAAAMALLCGCALLSGCSDKDIERTLGKPTADAIESTYRVVDDPLLADYINTMGHILVGHSRRQDIPYDFKVIETDIVNAAAVPWGYVYVTTGLLDFVESEDELWAITGHEIGHQVGRDSVKSVKENIILSLATILIGQQTSTGGDIADLGFDLLQLKHGRDAEYEADDHGTEVMYAAGYDPEAQVRFFERLMTEIQKNHPSRLETLFMTHPPSKARIRRQLARPELSAESADALVQIGAGYARRARYAEAIEKLGAALELHHEDLTARLLLARCHLARGNRAAAAEHYGAVLEANPLSVSAQEGLRAAQTNPPGPGDPAAAEEVARAGADIAAAIEEVEALANTVSASTAKLDKDLAPAAEAMDAGTEMLVGLSRSPMELPERAQRLAVETGLSLAHAGECVYALERVSAACEEVTQSLRQALASAESLQARSPAANDIAILSRSAQEARRCGRELEAVTEDMPALGNTARDAGRASRNAAMRIGDALRPGSTVPERQIAYDTLRHSRQRAEGAREEARQASQRVVLAQARSLTAELNIGALALGPDQAPAVDDLVAYYTQSDAQAVRQLREEKGLGVGEAALILAAAKSSLRPADALVSSAREGAGAVDAAVAAHAGLDYVNLFLKFIADSLAKEAAASQ